MKIALVDDDEQFAWLIKYQVEEYNLETKGDRVELSPWNNPVSFLKCMQASNEAICDYDIVIIDMKMPVMHGFDVHKELKDLCPDLKCFITSSSIEKQDTLDSMVRKEGFQIRDIISRSLTLSRFVNNLQINLRRPYYEKHYAY